MRILTAICLVAVVAGPRVGPPVHTVQDASPVGDPCVVSRIVDGDTFACKDGLKVRLIGIDSPEKGQGEFGAEAALALRRAMPVGTRVILERDMQLTDRYGRRLAHVWAGSVLVNEIMVRGGWAVLLTIPPDVKYAERLTVAQRAAREGKAGLWAEGGFACRPQDFRRRKC